ncbi:velvet factor-domain-containing protein [Powellomyces hirtus]|nr:velvet factor-domain-containing protein [Powellomyces hirtus]
MTGSTHQHIPRTMQGGVTASASCHGPIEPLAIPLRVASSPSQSHSHPLSELELQPQPHLATASPSVAYLLHPYPSCTTPALPVPHPTYASAAPSSGVPYGYSAAQSLMGAYPVIATPADMPLPNPADRPLSMPMHAPLPGDYTPQQHFQIPGSYGKPMPSTGSPVSMIGTSTKQLASAPTPAPHDHRRGSKSSVPDVIDDDAGTAKKPSGPGRKRHKLNARFPHASFTSSPTSLTDAAEGDRESASLWQRAAGQAATRQSQNDRVWGERSTSNRDLTWLCEMRGEYPPPILQIKLTREDGVPIVRYQLKSSHTRRSYPNAANTSATSSSTLLRPSRTGQSRAVTHCLQASASRLSSSSAAGGTVGGGQSAFPASEVLIGNLVSPCNVLSDLDGSKSMLFSFPDISVRVSGRYRIKFLVLDVKSSRVAEFAPSKDCTSATGQQCCPSSPAQRNPYSTNHCVLSDVFTVYHPKEFPGMADSTPLSKCLAQQGIRIHIRPDNHGKPKEEEDTSALSTA